MAFKLTNSLIPFIVVGGIGFMVDAGILTVLVHTLAWDPFGGRILSFLVAILVTWVLNRQWGFRKGKSKLKHREFVRYFSAQILGILINYGIFYGVLITYPSLEIYPVIPVAAGSAVAMTFNFIVLHLFVFVNPSMTRNNSRLLL